MTFVTELLRGVSHAGRSGIWTDAGRLRNLIKMFPRIPGPVSLLKYHYHVLSSSHFLCSLQIIPTCHARQSFLYSAKNFTQLLTPGQGKLWCSRSSEPTCGVKANCSISAWTTGLSRHWRCSRAWERILSRVCGVRMHFSCYSGP